MTDRTARRLSWSLWAATLALMAAGGALTILNRGTTLDREEWESSLGIGFLLLFLAFSTTGALIASRHRRNPIGWILLALGALGAVTSAGEGYALYALRTEPGSLPGGEAAAWLVGWGSGASSITLLGFVLLLFPSGSLPSRRWRPVAWTGIASLTLIFLSGFTPGELSTFGAFELTNPFGIDGAEALEAAGVIGFALAVGFTAAGVVALRRRLRRSVGAERQQLKWFAFAGALICAAFLAAPIIWSIPSVESSPLWPIIFLLSVGALPVATAIAILRHRLYDIDVVINRTLVYGSLTAILAGAYIGIVLLLQLAFSPVTEGSSLAVAGSTLAVAALFRPARRRIQAVVDRRFYRRKYDAERTLAAFSAHLRDEVDLDALHAELVGVVRETMQPAHVSLWLRGAQR